MQLLCWNTSAVCGTSKEHTCMDGAINVLIIYAGMTSK